METAKIILVNIDIKGKGTIQNKTMKVSGPKVTLEEIAGAWFWIKNEGCLKIGNDIYHTGNYDPEKDIVCSITPVENETFNHFSHNIIFLNNLQFNKYNSDQSVDKEILPIEPETTEEEQIENIPETENVFEDEIARLKSELESARRQLEVSEKATGDKFREAEQRIELISSEGILEDEIRELKVKLENNVQNNERMSEAYKNKIEELKAQVNELQSEHKITVETYEKALSVKRETLAKINKWMTRVSGIKEKASPNEKAAKIESFVHDRANLIDVNKRLKNTLEQHGAGGIETEKPSPDTQDQDVIDLEDGYNEDLEKAFKYVVISIHMGFKGDDSKTLDKIDRILNSFQVLNPEEEGLSEKSILVIGDFFESRNKGFSQSGLQDLGTMVNFFKDEVESMMKHADFSDPQQRVSSRQEFRDAYDGYNPLSSR